MDLFTTPSGVPSNIPWQLVVLSMLLAFILSQLIAITYERTHEGMSYSRSLFQTLALSSIVASALMFTIGNNLARGIGIAGIFAIVRFRTNLRDPRDIVFIFATLATGIACGIRAYSLAISGSVVFIIAAFYLKYVPLGSRRHFDGLLRFEMIPHPKGSEHVQELLQESCRRYALVTMRDNAQGDRLEYAYQLKLKHTSYQESLVQLVRELPHVSNVTLMMQETSVEL